MAFAFVMKWSKKRKGFGYQLQEICFGRKPETLIDSKQILGYPLWAFFFLVVFLALFEINPFSCIPKLRNV